MIVISFDPGQALGWAVGSYYDDQPYGMDEAGISEHGVRSFRYLLDHLQPYLNYPHVIVVEKFVPRSNSFIANISPVKVEGAMEFLWGDEIVWRRAAQKADVKDEILKESGMWRTGSMVDHEDGRDANDAIIHGLGYVKTLKHVPTLSHYWPGADI